MITIDKEVATMNLRELITDEEYIAIDNWRKDNCDVVDEIHYKDFMPSKELLRIWENSKQNLGKIFQGQLILSKPITYVEAPEEISDRLSRELMKKGHENARAFWHAFNDFCAAVSGASYECSCPYELCDFSNIGIGRISEDMSIYIRSGEHCNRDKDKVFILTKNSKTMKGISLFIKKMLKFFHEHPGAWSYYRPLSRLEPDLLAHYEDFRIFCSQMTNQRKLEGTLCLSIHPIDYMTMSDNSNGWSSCMSWADHGDYRMGTVEMMNSPNVIVAYLTDSKEKYNFGELDWTSKKWRSLFIVDPTLLCNIKGYPYFNDSLNHEVLSWVKELCTQVGWNYIDTPIEYHDCDDYQDVYKRTGYYLGKWEFWTDRMYNDFWYTHTFYPHVDMGTEESFSLSYSGHTQCMWCGKDISNEDMENTDESYLICEDCANACRCHHCGDIISSGDAILVGDDYYCPICYEDCIAYDALEMALDYKRDDRIYDTDSYMADCNDLYKYVIIIPGTSFNLCSFYSRWTPESSEFNWLFENLPELRWSDGEKMENYKRTSYWNSTILLNPLAIPSWFYDVLTEISVEYDLNTQLWFNIISFQTSISRLSMNTERLPEGMTRKDYANKVLECYRLGDEYNEFPELIDAIFPTLYWPALDKAEKEKADWENSTKEKLENSQKRNPLSAIAYKLKNFID